MSRGINKKTQEAYSLILELLKQPMTVREVSEIINLDIHMTFKHFSSLEKAKCIKAGELRIIKGRCAAHTFTSTGIEYVHVVRAKKVQATEAEIKPTLPMAKVYGMNVKSMRELYKHQTAHARSEYKSPKNYANTNSMAMF